MDFWLAVAPIIVLIAGFSLYCLSSLVQREARHLPKWAWAIVILISQPLGGIAYLALGRDER